MNTQQPSPYDEARDWINRCADTSGGVGLAKLVLSLYNEQCGFAVSECVGSMDQNLTRIALALIADYAAYGETEALRQLGRPLVDAYPGLWEHGLVMRDARAALRARWEREADEERRRLYPDD